MQIIGHRACPAHGPENTVAAVRTAGPHVDGVEIDVRRCGSGELVVVHDSDLRRLAGVDRAVDETSLDRLQEFTIGESDESIPTLATLLDSVPDDIFVNVELKEAGLGEDAAVAVDRAENDVLVSSFLPDALRELDESGLDERGNGESVSEHRSAFLFKYGWRGPLDLATELGCDAIHPQFRLLDEEGVETAHDRGFAVNAWTPGDRRDVAHLRKIGVDGVIVDDWQLAE